MKRCIVNVATGAHYVKGQKRLIEALDPLRDAGEAQGSVLYWRNELPTGCPPHEAIPYAFKAYALKAAAGTYDLLMWCDSSILPVRSLGLLWERIEREGYWFSNNGWNNYEWTADSAYQNLFPDFTETAARIINRHIPHVVATAFGLNVKHEKGAAFLQEYYWLASETKAFYGPWVNAFYPESTRPVDGRRVGWCGPADVRGHRHDQTAASVIAWRLRMQLTDPPDIFAYAGGENEKTILLAKGIE